MNSNKPRKILLVEDEVPLRKILNNALQKHGFLVLEANDGKTAVEVALHEHPDLILLDLLMPGMNGMAALKKIRQDVWGARVPVIILTNLSADTEELVRDMVEGHPICYLIKSDWQISDVIEKVREVLKVLGGLSV